jgi:hypothetical protein
MAAKKKLFQATHSATLSSKKCKIYLNVYTL